MADQFGWREDVGMDPASLSPSETDPEALLAEVVASGWPRLLVPRAQGGEGAAPAEVADALRRLARRHPAAGWMAWSQGLVIEALLQSSNVALREYLLPDLMSGERAGAVSWVPHMGVGLPPMPVQARPLERGWHLTGRLEQVLNLQWAGYVVLCPVWFEAEGRQPPRLGWTLLRSEEDGLRHLIDTSRPLTRQAACGPVHLDRVYFREDELLADQGDTLSASLLVLDQTLRAALWAGALQTTLTHGAST
jgi:alkylation response protein AidB-like acyl-CoA dehydrogenase